MNKRTYILAALLALATTSLFADKLPLPGPTWNQPEAGRPEWDRAKLAEIDARLRHLKPTSLIIVQDGTVVTDWGDTARKVRVYSVRKSILSALYGIGVAQGRIKLNRTLAELDIDDTEPKLSEQEKGATLRHLLSARSGIYHAAAYELGGAFAQNRPARGSHPPGAQWFYNNFDFNVLGTAYTKLMEEDIFEAVERRIAKPIGMVDFKAADGEYVYEPQSEHPAYTMRFTARDLARFGVLYLNRGWWNGTQVVPQDWIAQSTRRITTVSNGLGYGYLWWQLPVGMEGSRGAFFAMGKGGQAIAVVPTRGLVVVQTVDVKPNEDGLSTAQFIELLELIIAAAPASAT